MSKYLSPRDIDWTVLLIVLLICGVGVLQIYSATRDTDFTSAILRGICTFFPRVPKTISFF